MLYSIRFFDLRRVQFSKIKRISPGSWKDRFCLTLIRILSISPQNYFCNFTNFCESEKTVYTNDCSYIILVYRNSSKTT